MLWFGKGLKAFVGIVVVLVLGAAFVRWVVPYWGPVVLAGYGLIGAVFFVASLQRLKSGALDDRMFWASAELVGKRSGLMARARTKVAMMLTFATIPMAWPGVLISLIRRQHPTDASIQELSAASALAADTVTIVPLGMLASIGLATIALPVTYPTPMSGLIFCRICIVYAALLCLELLVARGMGRRLRRASGNPHLKALQLAAVVSAILILAYADLHAMRFPSQSHVASAAKGLYSQWDSIMKLLRGQHVSDLDVLQGTSGVLLFGAILNTLLSLGEFKRTDEDLAIIAGHRLSLGRPSEALKVLSGIRSHNSSSVVLKAVALVGVNQVDQAIEAFSQGRRLEAGAALASGLESTKGLLTTVFMYGRLPAESVLELFRHLLSHGCTQRDLFLFQQAFVGAGRISAARMLEFLSEANAAAQHPLAKASLLLDVAKNPQEVADAADLAASFVAEGNVLDLVQSTLALRASIIGPTSKDEDREAFASWCAQALKPIASMVPTIQDTEDLWLAVGITNTLVQLATELNSARLEEIRYLAAIASEQLISQSTDKDALDALFARFIPNAQMRLQP